MGITLSAIHPIVITNATIVDFPQLVSKTILLGYMLQFYADGALHAVIAKEASDHYPFAYPFDYVVFHSLDTSSLYPRCDGVDVRHMLGSLSLFLYLPSLIPHRSFRGYKILAKA